MGPVPIGINAEMQTPEAKIINNMSDSQFISSFFYGRTPAERLLTILQILAALFAITLAVKMLFFKNS